MIKKILKNYLSILSTTKIEIECVTPCFVLSSTSILEVYIHKYTHMQYIQYTFHVLWWYMHPTVVFYIKNMNVARSMLRLTKSVN